MGMIDAAEPAVADAAEPAVADAAEPAVAGTVEPAEAEAVLVSASGLHKSYGDHHAVRGIDIRIRRGEAFGLLGPNGAGKTSTMRMLACVSPRSGGELSVLGLDPDLAGPQIRARLGVVAQQDNLDTELNVNQNLLVYGRYFGLSRGHLREKSVQLLEFAQLSDRGDSRVDALSGGMRRRLTIARSLVNDPEILLLDEPTTALDPQARQVVWERLSALKRQGVTLIITTHYMDEAEQLCDRLAVMDQGRIVAEGTPAELIERYSSREVLELRFPAGDTAQADAVAGLGDRTEVLADRVLLFTHDAEAALNAVRARGIRPESSLMRRSTLEDVYLRITGRELVD
ncbi:ATP-binding cassette domain-containing protein [Kitasatospora kazusensis]|uniref:ATP-binding cassette domain-containing protein n=1 Tax=Kitasatospora kazusensis TaxID=407974 RepID=A0ABN2ZTA7_9ACTN